MQMQDWERARQNALARAGSQRAPVCQPATLANESNSTGSPFSAATLFAFVTTVSATTLGLIPLVEAIWIISFMMMATIRTAMTTMAIIIIIIMVIIGMIMTLSPKAYVFMTVYFVHCEVHALKFQANNQ